MLKYIVGLILLFAVACKHPASKVDNHLAKAPKPMELVDVKNDQVAHVFDSLMATVKGAVKDGYYLIIQIDGCGHCVDTGVNFAKYNLNSQKINFILTSEGGGKKIFNSKFSDDELAVNNIVLDPTSGFIREQYCQGRLCLLTVTNGKLKTRTQMEFEDVNENLAWLQTIIDEK